MTAIRPAPAAGLCAACEHRRLVPNTRGSTFSLCRRAAWDASLDRYPRLPVLSCHGHRREAMTDSSAATVAADG